MKKRIGSLFLAVLCLAVLMSMVSCDFLFSGDTGTSKNNNQQQSITVSIHIDKSYGITEKDFIGEGNKLTEPKTIPNKEGYDFVGWTSDEKGKTPLEFGKKITADLDIYPQWQLKKLTIIFEDEKELSTEDPIEVEYGDTILSLPEPEASGYNFVGWFEDTEGKRLFDLSQTVTENKVLYAVWTEIKYNITYITNGGELSENKATYTQFDETTLPDCEKEGYKFMGWYEKSDFSGSALTKIAVGSMGNKTYYAKFLCTSAEVTGKTKSVGVEDNKVTFSVSYVEATIDITDYLNFASNSTFSLSKDGYACSSIYLSENEGTEAKTYNYVLEVTSESGTVKKAYSVTVTQYTDQESFVRFYVDGSLTDTQNVVQGGKVSEPSSEPSAPSGYQFRYWRIIDAESSFDFETVIGENIDLEAYFEAITYTITFCQGYAEPVASINYTVEDEVTLPTPVCKNAEYDFGGWYDQDYFLKTTKINVGSTGNQTFYAQYKLKTRSVIDFYGVDSITKSQLADYLRYFYFNRLEEAHIEITGATEGDDFGSYFREINGQISMDGTAGCQSSYYSVIADENGVWKDTEHAIFSATYVSTFATLDSVDSGYEQIIPTETNIATSDRKADFNDFAIEHIADALTCSDSEQLFYAVEHGFRPVVVPSSSAERIYNKAKDILRAVIKNDMTDEEKALCLYEYIVMHNQYDHNTFDSVLSGDISASDSLSFKCFYLEGFFDKGLAVCDGISKSFTLLCRIEGLRVVQIEGSSTQDGSGHAWNKIYIEAGENEGAWYVIDCTSADVQLITGQEENRETNELLTHTFFLITDDKMSEKYNETEEEFVLEAETEYSYFDSYTFTQGGTEYSLKIDSDAEMNAFLKAICAFADEHNGEKVSLEIILDNGYSFMDGGYIKNAVVEGVEDFNSYEMVQAPNGNVSNFVLTKKGN